MSILSSWRSRLARAAPLGRADLSRELVDLKLAIGRTNSMLVRGRGPMTLREAEFGVFSQWGEDGIIQYLVGTVPIEREAFVEIGVQDYSECNTRFLLCNDNWEGLIVDSGTAHLRTLEEEGLRWRYRIDGVSRWVTPDNVNRILEQAGMTGDIGLLSLDIDGNDYWVLDALSVASPRILVTEYNGVFGSKEAVTVPYRADFDRRRAHPSWLYYGASLSALHEAAKAKGYRLIGSNQVGSNAFFVRSDVAGDLPDLTAEEAYRKSRIREARSVSGDLSYIDPHVDGLRLIADLPLWDVRSKREVPVKEILPGRGSV